ncbi:hypothetical protein [Streptomyces sp. x-80]|uniref:hypothetical protein n=1 Tax=Streptomyces sp. x-80 TaxID=2789282 RepID=UPI0039814A0E
MALAEFRALGERLGISFALTELADRIAVRGEFAGGCFGVPSNDHLLFPGAMRSRLNPARKSTPPLRPEVFSRIGSSSFSVVPG